MPQLVFEVACVAIIVLTLVWMARREPIGELVSNYVALAVAGWLSEESCMWLYRFYGYADVWSVYAHRMPLLVPLIWPLVILSGRAFVQALWPGNRWWSHALLGVVVAFDASLVEVVAVRAGLWSWSEPGHLGVPLIGMLGWGYFAVGASVALSFSKRWRPVAILVLAMAATHALILVSWWGLFRWFLRGDLGQASTFGVLVIGAIITVFVVRARRQNRSVSMAVAGPRMLAATLFLVLLVLSAGAEGPYWWHVLALTIPYVAALRGWAQQVPPTTPTMKQA